MSRTTHGIWRTTLLIAALAAAGTVQAGGLIDLDELEGATFNNDPTMIDNPWLPMEEDMRHILAAETEDGCEIVILDVLPLSDENYREEVFSPRVMHEVPVRTLLDRAYLVEETECEEFDFSDFDAEDEANIEDFLEEITLDWFAQDDFGRVWYFGEFSISLNQEDIDECEHDLAWMMLDYYGCPDGSWEAGKDFFGPEGDNEDLKVLEGVVMLSEEELEGKVKGAFYFQEYWEDEATDMAKILNFRDVDTVLDIFNEACLVTKDWVPLEPGNVEHKYYCYGTGLVLEEGVAGGKTVWTDLVFNSELED